MGDEENEGTFMVPIQPVPWYRRVFCCRKPHAQNYLLLEGAGNHPEEEERPQEEPSRLAQDWKTLKALFPYLWPQGELVLRVMVVLSLSCLLAAKLCDLFVPMVYRNIINDLTPTDKVIVYPLSWLLIYGALKLGSTLFGNLRDAFFIKVSQHAIRTLALETFEHLHRLSLRFHLQRRTGGVLRALERGNSAISTLLTFCLFNILPILVEISMVTFTLLGLFNVWFALITFSTVVLYVVFTVAFSEYRNQFRRAMNEADSDSNNKAVDSLLNFETVKYFNNEEMEAERYNGALLNYQAASIVSQNTLAVLNVGQSAIIASGLTAVMCYSGYRVAQGDMTVGDLVALNVYVIQLYSPLNFLGTAWRMIRSAIVDLEAMFALLENEIEIFDVPNAPDLQATAGSITFEDVGFSYSPDSPNVLNQVSFTVPGGKTLAIVGPSGGGKSTLTKLLYRFYSPCGGRILIDGQDISQVTQKSLRSHIGIVPQDTVLFNETIEYNIRYGRPNSTEDEVREAARRAHLSHFIDCQPDGYDTKVGERGLRLSGGEKQRMSIARCILKNPRIMILDEATSALDTHTEREIQANLDEITAGRTTIVVAHRLSTIVSADEIIILRDGGIAERGTHPSLLQLGGIYAEMWAKQQEGSGESQNAETSNPMFE